jgi:hypothetical protein
MNKIISAFLFIVVILSGTTSFSQDTLSLAEVIQRAKTQSAVSKQVETRKENRYWQYRFYKTNYNPQLQLQGNIPSYYKRVAQVQQPDGTFEYIQVEQTNNNLSLGLLQPISLTGGTVSVNTGLNYFFH